MSETILIPSSSKPVAAYLALPAKIPAPAVLVIHEVWGLNQHTKDVANRLAAEGYIALAPDLLSGTGVLEAITPDLITRMANPDTRDQAQLELRSAMAPLQQPGFAEATLTSLQECTNYLGTLPQSNKKYAVIGFCFGGTYAFSLAIADPNLSAVLPFYGHCDQSAKELAKIEAPILAFYGEQDSGLVDALPDLEKRMHEAGSNFTYKVYPNTGHAFFNDTNPVRYNMSAAEDSWQKSLAFLETHVSE
jgi:carboxymethylenebutenolidase